MRERPTDYILFVCTAMDISARPYKGEAFIEGTSNPGIITHQWGGVGRNIAECMTRLSLPPLLISSVGDDELGHAYIKWADKMGMPTQGISFSDSESTGIYSATMQADGELMHAVAGMHIFKTITPEQVLKFRKEIEEAAMVVVDGNISVETMRALVTTCAASDTEVWFEPTSVVKSLLPAQAGVTAHLTYISPNVEELNAMAAALDGSAMGTQPVVPSCIYPCVLGCTLTHAPPESRLGSRHGHGRAECVKAASRGSEECAGDHGSRRSHTLPARPRRRSSRRAPLPPRPVAGCRSRHRRRRLLRGWHGVGSPGAHGGRRRGGDSFRHGGGQVHGRVGRTGVASDIHARRHCRHHCQAWRFFPPTRAFGGWCPLARHAATTTI